VLEVQTVCSSPRRYSNPKEEEEEEEEALF
jgi:hypothetical protein